ncbi:METTL5 family protein [uncultured Methanobrevibacter sp.]|uniref:METTL5 family protein n=1 Tax=uncultured Methanobrevibacter sp. TaxID=253161 RepID=UPI0026289C5E|nr:METTL5 family protein [uncultured Methanobrevibacter sp.]
MKKITRKRHLEMRLQSVPPHPKPKVGLEQYTTPSIIASDLIWNAVSLGDIEDKNILDLGCGSGMLTIACALMGANMACGVDVDEDSIHLARQTSDKLNLDNVNYRLCDINQLDDSFDADTIIQNPPFGSQKKAKHGQDLNFVKKACELNPDVLYSFHMASTEEFLVNFYNDNGLDITHIFRYDFPIPKIYEFHTKENQNVDVIVFRALIDF